MDMDVLAALVAKALGAVGGAILALVFIWPATRKEALSRGVVSIFCGWAFEPHLSWYLSIPDTGEMTMGTAAAAAALSWWVMGAVIRLVRFGRRFEDER